MTQDGITERKTVVDGVLAETRLHAFSKCENANIRPGARKQVSVVHRPNKNDLRHSAYEEVDHEDDERTTSRCEPKAFNEAVDGAANGEAFSQTTMEPDILDIEGIIAHVHDEKCQISSGNSTPTGWCRRGNPAVGCGLTSPGASQIPNCTATSEDETWTITNTSLKAYSAMRGPESIADSDLYAWLKRCKKDDDHQGDFGPLLESCRSLVAHRGTSSEPWPSEFQDLIGQCVFSVPKPDYQHVRAPLQFDPEDHEEPIIEIPNSTIRRRTRHGKRDWSVEIDGLMPPNPLPLPDDGVKEDWDDDFYISDEEGDPVHGRISPCTFRFWAEGCRRWDLKRPGEDVGTQTATTLEGRISAAPGSYSQHSQHTTAEDNPTNEDPLPDDDKSSIETSTRSYSPLGAETTIRVEDWQRLVAKRLDHRYELPDAQDDDTNEVGNGRSLVGDQKTYTQSEIRTALADSNAPPSIGGVPPQEVEMTLRRRHQALKEHAVTQEQMIMAKMAAKARVAYRAFQLQRVSGAVQDVLQKRAEDARRKNREIYRQVSRSLRDADEECAEKTRNGRRLAEEMGVLLARERELVEKLREETLKIDVDGVYNSEDMEKLWWHWSHDEETRVEAEE